MSASGKGDCNGERGSSSSSIGGAAIPIAAIEFSEDADVSVSAHQPRQPANLQDLLRYSVEASGHQQMPDLTQQTAIRTGLRPPAMDDERRKWLEETLKHLTVDVVEMLLNAIEVLQRAGNLELQDDPSECERALEQIAEYIDNMDTANDFHKIGGFCIFQPCLDSAHSSLRWRAAEIIAELTQNNPYCQQRVLEVGLLPTLLALIDNDSNEQVRVKSLYAVSCLVRENRQAAKVFVHSNGFSMLLRAMQSNIEKLQIKSAFFLSSLCRYNEIKDELCAMGFVEQLVGMVTDFHRPVLEHLLCALLEMVRDHHFSQDECRRPELHLKETLAQLLGNLRDKDEYREEYDYGQQLLQLLFTGDTEER